MNILIVDDDDFKAQCVCEHLGKTHEIIRAKSYGSALNIMMDQHIDAVILDMGFPLWDEEWDSLKSDQGIHVLEEMERMELNIPVLVFSGNSHDVSAFQNVKGYVLQNHHNLRQSLQSFIENL